MSSFTVVVYRDSDKVEALLSKESISDVKYFESALSKRWNDTTCKFAVELKAFDGLDDLFVYLVVLELMVKRNYKAVFLSAERVIDILRVSLAFGFEECIKECLNFLEAVPWTPDEEESIIKLANTHLSCNQSQALLARVRSIPKWRSFVQPWIQDMLQKILNSDEPYDFRQRYCAFDPPIDKDALQWWKNSFVEIWRSIPWSEKEDNYMQLISGIKENIKLRIYVPPETWGGQMGFDIFYTWKVESDDVSDNFFQTFKQVEKLEWLLSFVETEENADLVIEFLLQDSLLASQICHYQQSECAKVTTLYDKILPLIVKTLAKISNGGFVIDKFKRMDIVKNWLFVFCVKKCKSDMFCDRDKNFAIDALKKIILTLPCEDQVALSKYFINTYGLSFPSIHFAEMIPYIKDLLKRPIR